MSENSHKNEALDALHKVRVSEADAKKKIQDTREKTSAKIIQDAYEEAEKIKEKINNSNKEED